MSEIAANLRDQLRKLWEEHVAWTRMLIISMASNLPDQEAVTQRLLQNPGDFAVLLRPIYGEIPSSIFASLLRSHLVIASQLIQASIKDDKQAAADLENRWYANAEEISQLLAHINPFWSKDEWNTMFREHLDLTKKQAVARLEKNYNEDIHLYDTIENQALEMADLMYSGIRRQVLE